MAFTQLQQLLLLLLLLILQVMGNATLVLGQSIGGDSIVLNQTLTEGQTLISTRQKFELGFFSPGNSKNRYLGIWFYNLTVQTVVWVANRATPFNSSTGTGILSLTADGNLLLSNEGGSMMFWSTGTSNASNPTLRLLDSANLVLSAGGANRVLWQSFDHLGDTFLSGMKLGVDYRTHTLWQLNSWKSADDPSPGEYYCRIEARGIPEIFVWRGSTKISRDYGPWNFQNFSISNGFYRLDLVSNASAVYLFPQVMDDSNKLRVVINATGSLFLLYWFPPSNSWRVYDDLPTNGCDHYALCGANSICDPSFSPICKCLNGFVPKSSPNWNEKKYSDGCVRKSSSNCSSDNFMVLKSMKMPDSLNATANANKTVDECRDWCLKNCSCTAYAMLGAYGCVTWFGDLLDIKVVGTARGDLFIRLSTTVLGSIGGSSSHKKLLLAIIIPSVLGFLLLCASLVLCFKKRNEKQVVQAKATQSLNIENGEDESELPLFGLLTIRDATNDFASENILGKGGFGIVYKGELGDGQNIAVKRLSKSSAQGINEFKTEVLLIAKLQHRNLVRLLGYCIEDDERILVYEYMQNGSLDAFIFDKGKSVKLDWHKRLDIIEGFARGLLYLHQDSRVKIIHRDLKTSNILLDEAMNPKISDFGMARILKGGQLEECTRRIVGTYGYMAPEYALDGRFSEKSDVFSFGVIVLQILTGKGNRVMTPEAEHNNLLDYAWRLWKENRSLELLEELGTSYPTDQVLRCIQIGLLCVQEMSEDRPTMTQVVLMLAKESIIVPQPGQPGFHSDSKSTEPSQVLVTNDVTLSVLEGR